MKISFPSSVDNFGFQQTREERNLYERTEKISLLDIIYMVHELEKAYFTLAGGTQAVPDVVVTSDSSLTAQISSLSSQITSLTIALAAVPVVTEGPGRPSASGRKTGDMHYDTTAKFWNRITEGVWQQLP
jgi:hypothetical protein